MQTPKYSRRLVLNDEQVEALEQVLLYLLEDEYKHWKEEGQTRNHIGYYLQVLDTHRKFTQYDIIQVDHANNTAK
jgi:hemerythrin